MKEKYFAYRCPDCGDTVLALMGSFSLSGDLLRLRCTCKKSFADIKAERGQKVHLSVPCPLCKKPHAYTIAPSLLLEREIFTLGCPYSPDIAVALMGEEEPLNKALMAEGERRAKRGKSAQGFSSVSQATALQNATGIAGVTGVGRASALRTIPPQKPKTTGVGMRSDKKGEEK